jgi:hypothetical protein
MGRVRRRQRLFCGLGTNTITLFYPAGGQTLRLDVFLSHNVAAGLESHSVSLNFDTDLGNELNLGPMASVEWAGTDANPDPAQNFPYSALSTGVTTLDSTGANPGRINSYESDHRRQRHGDLPEHHQLRGRDGEPGPCDSGAWNALAAGSRPGRRNPGGPAEPPLLSFIQPPAA